MVKAIYTAESGKDGLHHVIRQCGGPEEVFETHDSREMATFRVAEFNNEEKQVAAALGRLPRFLSP
jgi:hypothetical protein